MSFIHPGNIIEPLPWAKSSAEDTKKDTTIIFIIIPIAHVIELILKAGIMLSTLHAFKYFICRVLSSRDAIHFILHIPEGGTLVPCSTGSLGVVLSGGARAIPIVRVRNLEKIQITALVGRGSRFRSTFKHILSAR